MRFVDKKMLHVANRFSDQTFYRLVNYTEKYQNVLTKLNTTLVILNRMLNCRLHTLTLSFPYRATKHSGGCVEVDSTK